jgi:GNAT superfamily N-acetyltransferase
MHIDSLVRVPWTLRVGREILLVRPGTGRDLEAVARMHARCSARSLLDRYRSGGRAPAVLAMDALLRRPYTVVVVTATGDVVAVGTLQDDRQHDERCAEAGLLVEDRWQRLGIGSDVLGHLACTAHAAGYRELIAYPGTAVQAAQRLMIEVGVTRMVPDAPAHLHTYLSDAARLGIGSVRQRLAG